MEKHLILNVPNAATQEVWRTQLFEFCFCQMLFLFAKLKERMKEFPCCERMMVESRHCEPSEMVTEITRALSTRTGGLSWPFSISPSPFGAKSLNGFETTWTCWCVSWRCMTLCSLYVIRGMESGTAELFVGRFNGTGPELLIHGMVRSHGHDISNIAGISVAYLRAAPVAPLCMRKLQNRIRLFTEWSADTQAWDLCYWNAVKAKQWCHRSLIYLSAICVASNCITSQHNIANLPT